MLLNRSGLSSLVAVLTLVVSPTVVLAQAAQAPPPQITLPTVTVTAQKEPADPQQLPISLTFVPLEPLWNGGMNTIGDASIYAPNTYRTLHDGRVGGGSPRAEALVHALRQDLHFDWSWTLTGHK